YQGLHTQGIPLIVQSMPGTMYKPQLHLIDTFPRERFATGRPGLYYLADQDILEPYLGKQLLYWERSHSHWTPFSHELAGKALAELILRHGLLGPPQPLPRAVDSSESVGLGRGVLAEGYRAHQRTKGSIPGVRPGSRITSDGTNDARAMTQP